MLTVDLAIIGTGAGLIVADAAVRAGLSVALIEKDKVGGTCSNRGCIPSKMLVYPADLLRDNQLALKKSLQGAAPVVDFDRVSERTWRIIDFNKAMQADFEKTENLHLLMGTARFVDPHTLSVTTSRGEETVRFERAVIAAGARTRPVDRATGLDQIDYLTTETFFGDKYPKKPYKSLALIGGGVVAAEFAHIFSAYGTKVTIIQRSERMLRAYDKELADFAVDNLRHIGVDIHFHTLVAGAQTDEAGEKVLTLYDTQTGESRTERFEAVLYCPGVVPNTDILAVDKAGVAMDEHGFVITDEKLKTNQAHIYALGDINGRFLLRHKANYEAYLLVDNLFNGRSRSAHYGATPMAVFTHPQLAAVGMTEDEARAAHGDKILFARNRLSAITAGFARGVHPEAVDNGFAKLIFGPEGELLGAHIAGPEAASLVQPYVLVLNDRLLRERGDVAGDKGFIGTIDGIRMTQVIHPAISELAAWTVEGLTNDWQKSE